MHIGYDITASRVWLAVQSYKKYSDIFENIFCGVNWNSDVVRYETERAVAAVKGYCRLTTSMCLYGPTRPEEVEKLTEAAVADDISFIGYDISSVCLK